MISIDTVYQKVLSLANKEQRGYITPQEFNLAADIVQKEIFYNYFHNTKTAYHKLKNQMRVSFDEIEVIQEKLHPFKSSLLVQQSAGSPYLNIGTSYHLISTIRTKNYGEVTELTDREVIYSESNPLTKATVNRQVYVRDPSSYGVLRLYPTPTNDDTYEVVYFRKPDSPKWAYVVVNEKALYNSNLSVDFMLHPSEEEHLTTRILQLAGTIIEKPDIVQISAMDQASAKQEQND